MGEGTEVRGCLLSVCRQSLSSVKCRGRPKAEGKAQFLKSITKERKPVKIGVMAPMH